LTAPKARAVCESGGQNSGASQPQNAPESTNFRELTPLETRFVQEYLVDLNGSAACLRAGSTTRHPNKLAAQMKARPPVRRAIDAAMSERARQTGITAEWVLNNLKIVAERCLQAVPVLKRCAHQEEDGQGLWSFDASGAIRSLELIGKHRGMFKEQVDHTVKGKVVHEHGLCPRSEAILEMLTRGLTGGLTGATTGIMATTASSDITSNIYSNVGLDAGSELSEITGKIPTQDAHEQA
jgi:phage terminase small subunit